MNDVLGHDSVLVKGYTRPGTTCADDNFVNNFVMNHAPSAGSIARPVDQE